VLGCWVVKREVLCKVSPATTADHSSSSVPLPSRSLRLLSLARQASVMAAMAEALAMAKRLGVEPGVMTRVPGAE
jgi:hypothetical protein